MANWPNPTYNRIIETDPQIVKVPLDHFQWGSKNSIMAKLKGDPQGDNPAPPTAPEMTIKHI